MAAIDEILAGYEALRPAQEALYTALPLAGLYKPIWKYDAKTLAWDLGAHLAYGAGTGTTFWLITKII